MSLSLFQQVRFLKIAFFMAMAVTGMTTKSYAIGIVLLGEPGSGKGTLAGPLSAHYGMPVISGSEIVTRLSAADPTFAQAAQEMRKRGELLPDRPEYMGRVLETFATRISEPDCNKGFISDGIPRTAWQVAELNRILAARGKKIDAAILLEVKRTTIIERLAGRMVCTTCPKSYHKTFRPPVKEGYCDDPCGSALKTRADDSDEAVAVRLAIYDKEIGPVIELYRSLGILVPVDGNGLGEKTFELAKTALQAKGL